MSGFENVSVLVDAFHEAALEPELWQSALHRLAEALGGSPQVVLAGYDPAGGCLLHEAIRFDHAKWSYIQQEHGTPETNKYIQLINAARPGDILMPHRNMTRAEWHADPIYQKFFRPERLLDGLVCPLLHNDGGFASLAALRSDEYEARQIGLLAACASSLRHAMQVNLRLNKLARESQDQRAALEMLLAGVVLCHGSGRVAYANAAARAILDQRDGLFINRTGCLAAARPKETERLYTYLTSASRSATRGTRRIFQDNSLQAGGAAQFPRPSGRRPIMTLIVPLRATAMPQAAVSQNQASVIVILSDPESTRDFATDALRAMYGLTFAEAVLTRHLLAGGDLPLAAREMGISGNTAKTLLNRCFDRTGTNRQADLIGLILRGPLGVAQFTPGPQGTATKA